MQRKKEEKKKRKKKNKKKKKEKKKKEGNIVTTLHSSATCVIRTYMEKMDVSERREGLLSCSCTTWTRAKLSGAEQCTRTTYIRRGGRDRSAWRQQAEAKPSEGRSRPLGCSTRNDSLASTSWLPHCLPRSTRLAVDAVLFCSSLSTGTFLTLARTNF